MTDRITIDQAIDKARLTINMPATLIMMVAWAQALLIVPSGLAPMSIMAVSIFIGVSGWPMNWLYKAYMTPRWKLWAYSRVANVQQLKEAAIKARVLAADNSFAEKSEMCSKEVRAQILKLEGRA
ncbi:MULTISPECIES: hypothetical protein [Asticcacaulis]|uniref:hypothetical protein n=1 Tax=Asticcacaulis TaxID=76890 RepID=UPI001AEB77C9|nr:MULTISPECIES: hypothetical protein [Asticcacaulis]MBP2159643.1 hypothetical protein [Asticcacaulis solisilvae]MDR6800530.1 hypothetical protein [Asticcacaulis sp. BE141]